MLFSIDVKSCWFIYFAFSSSRWFYLFDSITCSKSLMPFKYMSFSLFAGFGAVTFLTGIEVGFFFGTLGVCYTVWSPKLMLDGLTFADAFSASISACLKNYSTLWNFWKKNSSILCSFSTSASGLNLFWLKYLSIDQLGLVYCIMSLPFRVKAGVDLSRDLFMVLIGSVWFSGCSS